MRNISVRDFINVTNAKLLCGSENTILGDFKKDTREIEVENGAKVCILQEVDIPNEFLKKYKDRVILKVEKTREALKKIAEFKRNMYEIPVVGVTGSVRKN